MANSVTKFKIQIIEARKQNTRRKLECCTAWVPFLQFSQKNNHSCIKLRLYSISKNDIIPHILYSLQCYYTLKTSSKIQRVEISHAVLMDKSLQAVQEQFPDVITHLDNTEMLLHQILFLIHKFCTKNCLLRDVRISAVTFSGEQTSAKIIIH